MRRAVLIASLAWIVYLSYVWVLPYYRSNGALAGGDAIGTAINVALVVVPPLLFLTIGLSTRAISRRLLVRRPRI